MNAKVPSLAVALLNEAALVLGVLYAFSSRQLDTSSVAFASHVAALYANYWVAVRDARSLRSPRAAGATGRLDLLGHAYLLLAGVGAVATLVGNFVALATYSNAAVDRFPATAGYRNPLDFTFALDPANYFDGVPRQIFRSGEVDAIVAYGAFGPDFFRTIRKFDETFANTPEGREMFDKFQEMMDSVLQRVATYPAKFNVPIVYVNPMGPADGICKALRGNGLPYFRFPDQAVRATRHLVEYGEAIIRAKEGGAGPKV